MYSSFLHFCSFVGMQIPSCNFRSHNPKSGLERSGVISLAACGIFRTCKISQVAFESIPTAQKNAFNKYLFSKYAVTQLRNQTSGSKWQQDSSGASLHPRSKARTLQNSNASDCTRDPKRGQATFY